MSSYEINIPSSRIITWMDTLRKYIGDEQYRILENFWGSQIKSKAWIINALKDLKNSNKIEMRGSGYVFGGWYGLMGAMLVDNFPLRAVYSIDQDPRCRFIGEELDRHDSIKPRINFLTTGMEEFRFEELDVVENYGLHSIAVSSAPAVIINTSTEHIDEEVFKTWLSNMPENVPIVLQGNNLNISEHIRCSNTLDEFKASNKLGYVLWEGELDCGTFTRYMIIGYKNEITDL